MYCNSPFVNVIIHPDETVEYGCCTIFEPIEKTRKDILDNNISNICKICESKYLFDGMRYQAQMNKKLLEQNRNDLYIEELNISICNECNLRCITCQLDHTKKDRIQINNIRYRKCNNLLIQGREPFLYKEALLNIITNIDFNNLTIITNGTIIEYDVLQYINSIKKNVNIVFSIDGVNKVNDYIRSNSDFKTLTNNIKNIMINYDKIGYSINFTVNIFNIINIVEYIIKLYEMFNIKINLNLLFDPQSLSIRNLDRKLKNKIITKIVHNAKILKKITINDSIKRLIILLNKNQIQDKDSFSKSLNKYLKLHNLDYKNFLDKETIEFLNDIGTYN